MAGRKDRISQEALQQAAEWLVQLDAGTADKARLKQWCNDDPQNSAALRRLAASDREIGRLAAMERELALRVFDIAEETTGRRTALKALIGISVGGGALWGLSQTPAVRRIAGDHATRVGETASVQLRNGVEVRLNTDTIVDETSGAGGTPLLRLRRGEAFVDTKGGTVDVVTAHGSFHTLGTRFLVRDLGRETRLEVIDGRVRYTPRDAVDAAGVVDAGTALLVGRRSVRPDPHALLSDAAGWLDGVLVARRMPLGSVMNEFARYHSRILYVTDEVANLPVSGVYRLDAVDDALIAIEATLPVRVRRLPAVLTILDARS